VNNMTKPFVLKGLDHFTKEEIESFWAGWNPRKDGAKLRAVGLSTILSCNFRCIYCYAGEKKRLNNELTLREQKGIIMQARELGAEVVILCGDAEPLMDGCLVDLVEYTHKCDMTPVVVTNGIVLGDDKLAQRVHRNSAKDLARILYDNGASLVVKLDSIKEDVYERTVGVKGAYAKFMKAVDNVVDVGFGNIIERDDDMVTRLAFSSVVMTINFDELGAIKEFANKRNAQYICKLPSLVGRALENTDVMFPVERYEDIRKILRGISAKRETLLADGMRCMAWHYGVVIDNQGEVRECYTSPCSPENRVGNIRDYSLAELVRRRNKIFDVLVNDVCPVKKRINQEFLKRQYKPLYRIEPSDMLNQNPSRGVGDI